MLAFREWFINPQEHRLRSGWRLIVQGLLFLVALIAVNITLGMILAIGSLIGGNNIQDPAVLNSLLSNPFARAAEAIGSLLGMVVTYFVAARWIDKRPWQDYGFHLSPKWWADFAFGLLLGALLMILIFAVELAAGWVTITGTLQSAPNASFWAGIAAMLVSFICVGLYEEMLSRGYQLRNLAEGLNFRFLSPRTALPLSYLTTSVIFGLLHGNNPNATVISTINLMIAGLFLGLGFVLTGELALPIGLHMTWNFFQGNVFGFPVSGTSSPATFIGIEQSGPNLWTGGAFGPEGGFIGLLAIGLGSLLIILWVRWQHGRTKLRQTIAIYAPPAGLYSGQVEPVPASTIENVDPTREDHPPEQPGDKQTRQ